MRNKFIFLYFSFTILFFGLFFAAPGQVLAHTNILNGATTKWAWNDVVGWINHYSEDNVVVSGTGLTGYASSSVGFISFDCATSPSGNICGASNYSVKNDGNGNLSGWAWNDNIGWISFCGVNGGGSADCPNTGVNYAVTIVSGSPNWKFIGWAWNDLVGWISFCNTGADCSGSPYAYDVETNWLATSTSGYVESTTYDTGVASGSIINSVTWIGTQPGGQFSIQFAGSDSSAGPWSYDETNTSYIISPCPPGSPVSSCANVQKVDYTLNNNRYFRYRIKLDSDTAQRLTPQLDDVIINWSP